MNACGREEVTRTPDPHVPNVVRYQLRYFSSRKLRLNTIRDDIAHMNFRRVPALRSEYRCTSIPPDWKPIKTQAERCFNRRGDFPIITRVVEQRSH